MNNSLIAILVLVVVIIVGWLAYSQGGADAEPQDDPNGIEIQIGGTAE